MKRLAALLVVASLGFALPASAQEQTAAQQQNAPAPAAEEPNPPPAEAPAVDASKLGISLRRISRELNRRASTETSEFAGRQLNIRVEVFGQAPPIELFNDKDFSLTTGPVPRSAPTHREHIEFVTPEEFKAPAMNFMNLAVWAAQKIGEGRKKSKCEEEIEIYRRTLMQGIPVTAPRCAQ